MRPPAVSCVGLRTQLIQPHEVKASRHRRELAQWQPGHPAGDRPSAAATVALTVWYPGKAASQAAPTIKAVVIEAAMAREGGVGESPGQIFLWFPLPSATSCLRPSRTVSAPSGSKKRGTSNAPVPCRCRLPPAIQPGLPCPPLPTR
jgi:hypothetical protein